MYQTSPTASFSPWPPVGGTIMEPGSPASSRRPKRIGSQTKLRMAVTLFLQDRAGGEPETVGAGKPGIERLPDPFIGPICRIRIRGGIADRAG